MTVQPESRYTLATTGHKKLSALGTTGHPAPPPHSAYSLENRGHREPRPRNTFSLVTTGCPRPGHAPYHLAQAFAARELEQASRDKRVAGIVHHGAAVALPGFDLVHSHAELLAVFARRRSGDVESVSVSRVIDGLVRGIDRGDSSRPILRHCGALNRRALKFALEQIGVRIGEPQPGRSFGSYAALASAGTRASGALMIGLRGRNVRAPGVSALRLNGFCPLATSTHERYPLQYEVHFYLRKNEPEASRHLAVEYLKSIRERMALDNEAFSLHGGLVN